MARLPFQIEGIADRFAILRVAVPPQGGQTVGQAVLRLVALAGATPFASCASTLVLLALLILIALGLLRSPAAIPLAVGPLGDCVATV